jgi:hypothetical protein
MEHTLLGLLGSGLLTTAALTVLAAFVLGVFGLLAESAAAETPVSESGLGGLVAVAVTSAVMGGLLRHAGAPSAPILSANREPR